MIVKSNLGVNGKFKFDVYSKEGNLKYFTESDNFITNTGLSYVSEFALADCWRYLSIGSGNAGNSATGNNIGTTGLSIPLGTGLSYLGGNTNMGYCLEKNNRYISKG